MKKGYRVFLILLMLCGVLLMASCGGVKVTFDIGDATLVSGELEQKYKEGAPIVAPVLEKDGYVFDGWDTDFSAPTEEMTVKPKWKKLYTVTFDAAGGTAEDALLMTQKIAEGSDAKIPTVTREGYVFDGWDKEFSAVSGDLAVTAAWKKIHTVTFDPAGGNAEDESLLVQKVVDGESAVLPTVVRDKYIFLAWEYDGSAVTGDMTVKATWERKRYGSSEIFNVVNPATVEIKTYRLNDVYMGIGSGFFISEDGVLLTNYHVIEESRICKVQTSDGKIYEVSAVLGYDIEKDIALLQVNTKGEKVAFLEIAEELPRSGDAVYAIGSSLGLTGTFSSGIVSYVNREIDGVKFIQTTTPISEGNSGGPLVNEYGLVVGINSASYTEGQNLNLAVEISQYKSLPKMTNMTSEDLFQKEAKIRWWFGERLVSENPALSETTGQVLESGSTVQGKIEDPEVSDFYLLPYTKDTMALFVMIKAENEKALRELATYSFPFYTESTVEKGYWFPDAFYRVTLEDDGNGTVYAIGAAVTLFDDDTIDKVKYIGMCVGAESRVEYEIFVYAMTAEMLNLV